MKIISIAALALVIAGSAQAHDLWLEPAAGGIQAVYGHAGEGGGADRYRVFEVDAVVAGKPISLLDGLKSGYDTLPVLALPAAAKEVRVVAARYDGGFWVKTPTGSRNTSKLNLANVLESRWSLKFAKLVLPGASALGEPVGQRLEIVPLADPYRLKAGEALKVRVDYAGKPLPGASLTIGDGKTKTDQPGKVAADASGIAVIQPLPGMTILTVSHKTGGTAPDLATEDALSATLAFTADR
jgi:nickel transport protein